ncbi:MAG: hypothetical protein KC731_07745 [Myxococcales bacterium]|nr:hypothetical protein [Myxococcales bacterium]
MLEQFDWDESESTNPSIRPTAESSMPPSGMRTVTPPIDDEDQRATVRREVVKLPAPHLMAPHLMAPELPEIAFEIPPPPPARASSLSLPSDAQLRLEGKVHRLERWLIASTCLAVAALAAVIVLGLGRLEGSAAHLSVVFPDAPPSAPVVAGPARDVASGEQGFTATSTQPGIRVFVDAEERGILPLTLRDLSPGSHALRFEGHAGLAPLERRIAVDPGRIVDLGMIRLDQIRVEVVVSVSSPYANVALTPIGGMPEALPGPWPRAIYLDPGKYTISATKRGRTPAMRMLDLTLDRPHREVALSIR